MFIKCEFEIILQSLIGIPEVPKGDCLIVRVKQC